MRKKDLAFHRERHNGRTEIKGSSEAETSIPNNEGAMIDFFNKFTNNGISVLKKKSYEYSKIKALVDYLLKLNEETRKYVLELPVVRSAIAGYVDRVQGLKGKKMDKMVKIDSLAEAMRKPVEKSAENYNNMLVEAVAGQAAQLEGIVNEEERGKLRIVKAGLQPPSEPSVATQQLHAIRGEGPQEPAQNEELSRLDVIEGDLEKLRSDREAIGEDLDKHLKSPRPSFFSRENRKKYDLITTNYQENLKELGRKISLLESEFTQIVESQIAPSDEELESIGKLADKIKARQARPTQKVSVVEAPTSIESTRNLTIGETIKLKEKEHAALLKLGTEDSKRAATDLQNEIFRLKIELFKEKIKKERPAPPTAYESAYESGVNKQVAEEWHESVEQDETIGRSIASGEADLSGSSIIRPRLERGAGFTNMLTGETTDLGNSQPADVWGVAGKISDKEGGFSETQEVVKQMWGLFDDLKFKNADFKNISDNLNKELKWYDVAGRLERRRWENDLEVLRKEVLFKIEQINDFIRLLPKDAIKKFPKLENEIRKWEINIGSFLKFKPTEVEPATTKDTTADRKNTLVQLRKVFAGIALMASLSPVLGDSGERVEKLPEPAGVSSFKKVGFKVGDTGTGRKSTAEVIPNAAVQNIRSSGEPSMGSLAPTEGVLPVASNRAATHEHRHGGADVHTQKPIQTETVNAASRLEKLSHDIRLAGRIGEITRDWSFVEEIIRKTEANTNKIAEMVTAGEASEADLKAAEKILGKLYIELASRLWPNHVEVKTNMFASADTTLNSIGRYATVVKSSEIFDMFIAKVEAVKNECEKKLSDPDSDVVKNAEDRIKRATNLLNELYSRRENRG